MLLMFISNSIREMRKNQLDPAAIAAARDIAASIREEIQDTSVIQDESGDIWVVTANRVFTAKARRLNQELGIGVKEERRLV